MATQDKEDRLASAKVRAGNHLALYQSTRNGLAVWRAYRTYRRLGVPLPETILAKLDQWAKGLETAHGTREIAAVLELTPPRGGAGGVAALRASDRRRRIFSAVEHEREQFPADKLTTIYKRIAPLFDTTIKSVKDTHLAVQEENAERRR